MKQLKIIYNMDKCIGASFCESIDPDHFIIKNNKAELIGGTSNKKSSFYLELNPLNEEQKAKVIEAAMSCPVNAIAVKDLRKNVFIISSEITEEKAKELKASYNEGKEWKLDPKGYFLIRTDPKKGIIEIGHCMERNIVDTKITGKTATEIFNTIIRENLISSLQHASYLGKELYKAELALKNKMKYIQDEDLKIK